MTEIANCKLCGRTPYELQHTILVSIACYCGCRGPMEPSKKLAIESWNRLHATAPEQPKAGMVRVPKMLAHGNDDSIIVVASDDTIWCGNWYSGGWEQLPPLPQPAEITGTTEQSND